MPAYDGRRGNGLGGEPLEPLELRAELCLEPCPRPLLGLEFAFERAGIQRLDLTAERLRFGLRCGQRLAGPLMRGPLLLGVLLGLMLRLDRLPLGSPYGRELGLERVALLGAPAREVVELRREPVGFGA